MQFGISHFDTTGGPIRHHWFRAANLCILAFLPYATICWAAIVLRFRSPPSGIERDRVTRNDPSLIGTELSSSAIFHAFALLDLLSSINLRKVVHYFDRPTCQFLYIYLAQCRSINYSKYSFTVFEMIFVFWIPSWCEHMKMSAYASREYIPHVLSCEISVVIHSTIQILAGYIVWLLKGLFDNLFGRVVCIFYFFLSYIWTFHLIEAVFSYRDGLV